MKSTKKILGSCILVLLVLCILLPLVTILIWVVTERWTWPDLIPQTFSLRAVKAVIRDGRQLSALFVSSVGISLMVATLSVVIAVLTARALELYSFRGKQVYSFLSILPFLVPGTVFAMGIQVTFIRLGLGGTIPGVVIAHLICSLPYAVILLQDGTRALGDRLEEQARVLGANARQAFFKVSFPNLMPVMLSAFSMAYIISFSQYFLTLMIGGGSVKTFTVVMVPYIQSGERNFAGIYSLIFLILTILIFGVFEWLVNRMTGNQEVEYY